MENGPRPILARSRPRPRDRARSLGFLVHYFHIYVHGIGPKAILCHCRAIFSRAVLSHDMGIIFHRPAAGVYQRVDGARL